MQIHIDRLCFNSNVAYNIGVMSLLFKTNYLNNCKICSESNGGVNFPSRYLQLDYYFSEALAELRAAAGITAVEINAQEPFGLYHPSTSQLTTR